MLSSCREARVAPGVTSLTPGEGKCFLKGDSITTDSVVGDRRHRPSVPPPALPLAETVVVSREPCDVRSRVEATAVTRLCQRRIGADLQGHGDCHTPCAPRCPGPVLPAQPLSGLGPMQTRDFPRPRAGRGDAHCAQSSHKEVSSPAPSTSVCGRDTQGQCAADSGRGRGGQGHCRHCHRAPPRSARKGGFQGHGLGPAPRMTGPSGKLDTGGSEQVPASPLWLLPGTDSA